MPAHKLQQVCSRACACDIFFALGFTYASLHKFLLVLQQQMISKQLRGTQNRWKQKQRVRVLTPNIPDLHFWLVVTLDHLRGEVLQAEGCLQGGPHSI